MHTLFACHFAMADPTKHSELVETGKLGASLAELLDVVDGQILVTAAALAEGRGGA